MSEFSLRSMRQALREKSDKRVSEELSKNLGDYLDSKLEGRAEKAAAKAAERDRVTVRDTDLKSTRRYNPSVKTGFDIPKAPFERILRRHSDRVAESAIKELREEAYHILEDVIEDVVESCEHAGRKTIKSKDLELTVEG